MPTRTGMLGDGTISREEPLSVARWFEPLHALLSLTRGLVRILRTVVQIPMLTMFHPGEDLALGGSVALEFIGADHAWDGG
jgi:hypothetical protein